MAFLKMYDKTAGVTVVRKVESVDISGFVAALKRRSQRFIVLSYRCI